MSQINHLLSNKFIQKGFSAIFVLIGVLVIAAIGGAYYFGKLSTLPTQNPHASSLPVPPILTPTPQPSADETTNWKTYTNTIFGFSIKYPSDWKVYEVITKPLTPEVKGAHIININPPDNPFSPGISGGFDNAISLWVNTYDSNLSLMDWVKNYEGDLRLLPDNYFKPLKIGNYDAIKIDYTQTPEMQNYLQAKGAIGGQGGPLPNGLREIVVYIRKDTLTFQIQAQKITNPDSFLNIFNQMLSTFKFLPASLSGGDQNAGTKDCKVGGCSGEI